MHKADRHIANVYEWIKENNKRVGGYSCDLIQHVFCIICEEDKDFIVDLANRQKLKGYVIKILYNTSKWQRTNYSKQLAENEVPTDIFEDVPDTVYEEIDIPLHKLHFYKAGILELYAALGNYRAVSRQTTIPISNIFDTVKKARKEIIKLL